MYDTGFGKLEQILDQQSQILTQQAQILQNQETLAQEIKAQVVKLIDLVQSNGTKKKPGPILFIIAGEDQMADKIIFRVVLPNASAADVKTREITVDIDGEVLCWVTDVVGGWLMGTGWLLVVAGVCLWQWAPGSPRDLAVRRAADDEPPGAAPV